MWGMYGYDNIYPEMPAVFMGVVPKFKIISRIPVLGLWSVKPALNNGGTAVTQPLLRLY